MSFSSSQSSSLSMGPWGWVFDDPVMAGWDESPYSMPISSQPLDELFNVYSSVPLSRGVSSEGSTTNPQSLPASPLSANFDSVQSSPVFGPCFDQSLGHFDFVPDLSLSPGSAPASFPMYPQTLMEIPRTVPYRQSPPTSGILAHSRSIAHNARRARRARPATRPSGGYACLSAGCGSGPFNRYADLERHYRDCHCPEEEREAFPCDYKKCPRNVDPFRRRDHFRDHLRDYHKEDMEKRGVPVTDEWLDGRYIPSDWWRCIKCLERIHIEPHGFECPSCKVPCHEKRREKRQRVA
ncbi:unnamed protein product [Clonostachys rhizophaga]|uniref:C2H2-type domain-containing protein n=1 Tax=Clonostachys rhizophaga TaxID=160324 RepID=A0A9N9YCA2_9HYPO|nr:unnamed protein product [Clonostachys rhizophaga]